MHTKPEIPFEKIETVTDADLKNDRIRKIICRRMKEAVKEFKRTTPQTNREIAEIIGISVSNLSGYLYNTPYFPLKRNRFELLARYCGADPIDILEMPIPDMPEFGLEYTGDDFWEEAKEAANDSDADLPPIEPLFSVEDWRQDAIVKNLKDAFDAHGAEQFKTQRQMADEMGWSAGTLNQYLLGNQKIAYTALFKMCNYIGISPFDVDPTLSDVVGFNEPDPYSDQQIVDLVFDRAPTMSAEALKSIMTECMVVGWGMKGETTDHTILDDKGWPSDL